MCDVYATAAEHTSAYDNLKAGVCGMTVLLQGFEVPEGSFPYYWLLPRHQLVVLAGWGRAMRLALLDLDEYLVLPAAAAAGAAAAGNSLEAAPCTKLAWRQQQLQESMLQHAVAFMSSTAGEQQQRRQQAPDSPTAVLRVARFDTRLITNCTTTTSSSSSSSQDAAASAACVQQHATWYKAPGQELQVSQCPVEPGGLRASRKPLVVPHYVVVLRPAHCSSQGGRAGRPHAAHHMRLPAAHHKPAACSSRGRRWCSVASGGCRPGPLLLLRASWCLTGR